MRLLAPLASWLIAALLLVSSTFAHAQQSIATFITPTISDVDARARELVAKIKADGRKVKKAHVFWVSSDPHPGPKVEAALRILHLGLQDDPLVQKDVLEFHRIDPADYERILEEKAQELEGELMTRFQFIRDASGAISGQGAPPVDLGPFRTAAASDALAQTIAQSWFSRAKIGFAHFFGLPNGVKFREIYKRPVDRKKRIMSLMSAAIQIGLTSIIGYTAVGPQQILPLGLHEAHVYAMMAVSAGFTFFFAYNPEANFAWRTQGVDFRVRKDQEGNETYDMAPNRAWLYLSSIGGHSVPSRQAGLIAGFGPFYNMSRAVDGVMASVISTTTRAFWEKKIEELRRKEASRRGEFAKAGVEYRRPEWSEPSFLLNTGLQIASGTLSFCYQFGVLPKVIKDTLFGLGVAGALFESAVVERARTVTSIRRMARVLRSGRTSAADEGCELALSVEYEE